MENIAHLQHLEFDPGSQSLAESVCLPGAVFLLPSVDGFVSQSAQEERLGKTFLDEDVSLVSPLRVEARRLPALLPELFARNQSELAIPSNGDTKALFQISGHLF